jgi:hypothetical protein
MLQHSITQPLNTQNFPSIPNLKWGKPPNQLINPLKIISLPHVPLPYNISKSIPIPYLNSQCTLVKFEQKLETCHQHSLLKHCSTHTLQNQRKVRNLLAPTCFQYKPAKHPITHPWISTFLDKLGKGCKWTRRQCNLHQACPKTKTNATSPFALHQSIKLNCIP